MTQASQPAIARRGLALAAAIVAAWMAIHVGAIFYWPWSPGTVPLALFGPEGYAVLMGRLAAPAMVAQALAPPAAAVLFEATGARGTMTALAALAVVNLAAVAMLVLVSRRRATGI